jgi:hypothetical protein
MSNIIQSVKKFNDPYENKLNCYILTTTDGIIKNVPLSEGNKDYQAIQEWVADGNTIQEAD